MNYLLKGSVPLFRYTNLAYKSSLYAMNNYYSFSDLKKIKNSQVLRQLPDIKLPLLQSGDFNERIEQKIIYDRTGFQEKQKQPRCNYYALERKGRIYHVYNAYYYPMGRMIQHISEAIRGRNSPLYRNNHADIQNGDICVIVNASDPLFTGKKLLFKELKYHTGFVGHLRRKSYKSILNEKPQLLYHYLLRRAMPKNYISMKYLENLKIYRGPTHDIPNLPQFAPDKNVYHNLPQFSLNQLLKNPQGSKIVFESQQGIGAKIFGRDLPYADIPNQQFEEKRKTKHVPNMSKQQYEKLQRKAKRLEERYKRISAPYKKKTKEDLGFTYFDDERLAKKTPYYNQMADEDAPQEDDEPNQDPFDPNYKPTGQ